MYLALKVRLEDELFAIEQTISTLNTLLSQANTIPEIALDRKRVLELAENVPTVFNQIQQAVEIVNTWLTQQAESK